MQNNVALTEEKVLEAAKLPMGSDGARALGPAGVGGPSAPPMGGENEQARRYSGGPARRGEQTSPERIYAFATGAFIRLRM